MRPSFGPGEPGASGWNLRLLSTAAEIAEAEVLQRAVWPGNDIEVVPTHVLLTAAHNGGLVAGAFAEGRLAGFVWGFLGTDTSVSPPRLKHCSHQLGVHPDYRNTGIGYALKCFQREFVLSQGLDRITWTYDPLLARNARLNIARLGAVCRTYFRNLYGAMQDDLNAGLPSDRFQVDWWIASERVTDRVAGKARARPTLSALLLAGATLLNPPASTGRPEPPDLGSGAALAGEVLLIEIPPDFLALKAADPAMALRWRLATRDAFETLFERGFAVTDFVSGAGPSPRTAYVLTRPADP